MLETWRTAQKQKKGGFPGGSVAKNPLAKAGGTGSILDPGRSTCRHRAIKPICRSSWTCALGPVSRSYGGLPVLGPRPHSRRSRRRQTPAHTCGKARTQEGPHAGRPARPEGNAVIEGGNWTPLHLPYFTSSHLPAWKWSQGVNIISVF